PSPPPGLVFRPFGEPLWFAPSALPEAGRLGHRLTACNSARHFSPKARRSSLNKVELVSSNGVPDLPGNRVTVVRVPYGPGGFTPPHRHAGHGVHHQRPNQGATQRRSG